MARMTRGTRTELARTQRKRYLAATIRQKQTILKEFIAATGYHPKSAIRILNASPAEKTPRTRLRRPLYDEASRTALIVLWEASDRYAVNACALCCPSFFRLWSGMGICASTRLSEPEC
jgi:hypothetical protein